jgi:predicted nucleotide-binding protein
MIKVFIGSSTAARRQARLLIEGCKHPNITYLPWWDQFTAGRTLLEELDRIRKKVDACILLLTPEGVATNSKNNQVVIPNMNVLFEFGYFYSALGKESVALAKYGKVNLPSDLGGYIHIAGSDFFKPNYGVPVGKKTKKEFDRWIDALISK